MAVSTKAFTKFASDSPVDFGSEFNENPSKIVRKSASNVLAERNRLPKRSGARFGLDFALLGVLLGALGCLWAILGAPLGDLGGPRGRLWGVLGLPWGSLGALQEPLGTPQDHLEPPGDGLGGFLLQKPPKMVTIHTNFCVFENVNI